MKIFYKPRKSRALGTGLPRCLAGSGAHSLNVARGCLMDCAYCSYRTLPSSPPSDEIILYDDLARQLDEELSSTFSRGSPPPLVLVNTGTDCFMGVREVEDVAVDCIRVLLEHRIPLHITTKGMIPQRVIDLGARRPGLMRVSVSLSSMDPMIHKEFEPLSPTPVERLAMLRELHLAGLDLRVRLEPLMPMVNDGTEELSELLRQIYKVGVRRFSVSYMQMRKGLPERLMRMLGPIRAATLVGWYQETDMATGKRMRTALLPRGDRLGAYRHLWTMSRKLNMKMSNCSCRNPDMEALGVCYPVPDARPGGPNRQLTLL